MKTSDAGVGPDAGPLGTLGPEDIKHEVKQEKIIVKKEAQQWFDVGFIKATSCTVSHYHLPNPDTSQNTEVKSKLWNVVMLYINHFLT